MNDSLAAFLGRQLGATRACDRYRRRRVVSGAHGAVARVDGRLCVNFCSNDYLGLAGHPALARALAAGAAALGSGSGASQLITGHNREHAALEEELADYSGHERALLFATGYAANTGTIAALVGRDDSIVADALNHASLIDGARLAGAAKHIYPHADAAAARAALRACSGRHRLLVSDTVFSMDGDLAPLAGLAEAAAGRDAWLMVDDAHGFGVLGGGRGALHDPAAGRPDGDTQAGLLRPDIYVATLGKAVGAAGAFVAGDSALIDFLIQRSRSLIYSTAPPPALAAAARAGLGLLRAEDWRRDHLRQLIRRFRRGCEQLGIAVGSTHPGVPIQPLILGSEARALAASEALLARGFLVAAIRPPTVAAGSSRLRITLTAGHDEAQVDGLLQALGEAWAPVVAGAAR